MLVLTIRTDQPEAEIGLYKDGQIIAERRWAAHRQLAETLHSTIGNLLADNGISFEQLNGIVVYAGPGSFTGLRIGVSVANALSYSCQIPIVASHTGNWQSDGISSLHSATIKYIAPFYGMPATITKPK